MDLRRASGKGVNLQSTSMARKKKGTGGYDDLKTLQWQSQGRPGGEASHPKGPLIKRGAWDSSGEEDRHLCKLKQGRKEVRGKG